MATIVVDKHANNKQIMVTFFSPCNFFLFKPSLYLLQYEIKFRFWLTVHQNCQKILTLYKAFLHLLCFCWIASGVVGFFCTCDFWHVVCSTHYPCIPSGIISGKKDFIIHLHGKVNLDLFLVHCSSTWLNTYTI